MSPPRNEAELAAIAAEFAVSGRFASAEPLAGGHINESYCVTFEGRDGPHRYVLQGINSSVFPFPLDVTENVSRVCAHIRRHVEAEPMPASQRDRRALTLVPSRRGPPLAIVEPDAWRMFHFVERSYMRSTAADATQARLAAAAFGRFQRLLSDLGDRRPRETIPRFHDTPSRYDAFEEAVSRDAAGRAGEVAQEIEFARRHEMLASRLIDLYDCGAIPERIVHNDAKIANVLFCEVTHEALCVVDLDTVMPGLSLFDFGDMVRSMGTRAAEDEPDPSRVAIDADLLAAVAAGYLSEASSFLTELEEVHLITAGQVITYEQGLRFLTDYLDGDRYYRTTRPGQNLDRTRRHFRLAELLVRDEAALRRLCEQAGR